MARRPSDDAFRRVAKESYRCDGDLEFDEVPVISLSDDGGAYVQCWKWIYDSEAQPAPKTEPKLHYLRIIANDGYKYLLCGRNHQTCLSTLSLPHVTCRQCLAIETRRA